MISILIGIVLGITLGIGYRVVYALRLRRAKRLLRAVIRELAQRRDITIWESDGDSHV